MPACWAKAISSGSLRGDVVEHAGQELRIAGGAADVARADAGGGEEAAEVLRLGGEVRQRRDGEPFGRFAAGAVFAASGFGVFHGRRDSPGKLSNPAERVPQNRL